MRTAIISGGVVFLSLWGLTIAALSGSLLPEVFEHFAPSLLRPASTAELGDSMGIFNGLLSSVAVLLALAAVVMQGKALHQQNAQHASALKVSALSTRLQFLNAEVERLGGQANSIDDQIKRATDAGQKSELYKIMRASRNKQLRLRDEAEQVNAQLTAMLETISTPIR